MNAEQSAPAAAAAAAASARSRGGRRSLAVTLLLSVLGAALLLLASGRGWVSGQVQAQGVLRELSATGGQVTGLPSAMALVGLASVVAVFAVRGRARGVLGALVALAGAAAVWASVAAAADSGSHALDERAARSVGIVGIQATAVTHSIWPWLAALGGLLLLAAGLLTVARGRDWPGMSARYDAPAGAGARAAARADAGSGAAATPRRAARAGISQTPADIWKALDRGEDPTAS